jgi:hypothetical protein
VSGSKPRKTDPRLVFPFCGIARLARQLPAGGPFLRGLNTGAQDSPGGYALEVNT